MFRKCIECNRKLVWNSTTVRHELRTVGPKLSSLQTARREPSPIWAARTRNRPRSARVTCSNRMLGNDLNNQRNDLVLVILSVTDGGYYMNLRFN